VESVIFVCTAYNLNSKRKVIKRSQAYMERSTIRKQFSGLSLYFFNFQMADLSIEYFLKPHEVLHNHFDASCAAKLPEVHFCSYGPTKPTAAKQMMEQFFLARGRYSVVVSLWRHFFCLFLFGCMLSCPRLLNMLSCFCACNICDQSSSSSITERIFLARYLFGVLHVLLSLFILGFLRFLF